MKSEYASDPEDFRLTQTGSGLSLIKKSRAITNPARHFHPWWEILYIVSGERTFFYANRTLHIQAGTFLCIAPGVLHRAINPADEVCSLYNLYFGDNGNPTSSEDSRMHSIQGLLDDLDPCIALSPSNQAVVTSLFERVAHELLNPQKSTDALVWSLVTQMLVCVQRENGIDTSSVQVSEHMKGRLSELMDYLNAHFREDLTLEDVARRFDVTPAHLSRTFKKATRFGFVEYINTQRVAECCRLLRTTDLSVLDIALQCGFGSLTQFGRCFRELTGSSPRGYRRDYEGR